MEKIRINQQIFKLRKEKGVTQEELARAVGVTNQAVSKWESGICCPDVQLLPDLARYFNVSIDTLFGEKDIYDISRGEQHNELLYTESEKETVLSSYEKKIADENAQAKDYLAYAELLDKFAWDYIKKAQNGYMKTMDLTKDEHTSEYYRAQKKWVQMYGRLGRSESCIKQYRQQLAEDPSLWWNHYILAFAYKEAGKMQEAWNVLETAMEKFEQNAVLYELAGDICRAREYYDEAISYWTKAFEMDSEKCSSLYSKAYLYEKLEQYERAITMWEEIIRWRHEHGQDENHELDWPLVKIENLNRLINKRNTDNG